MPYILLKLLTPRLFVLEYVKEVVEVDEIHFHKYKKRGRVIFPIVMGGYSIHDNRGKMAIMVFETLDFSRTHHGCMIPNF